MSSDSEFENCRCTTHEYTIYDDGCCPGRCDKCRDCYCCVHGTGRCFIYLFNNEYEEEYKLCYYCEKEKEKKK